MPFKTWSVGEEVLASDFNPYLQQQVVARFASAAARSAAITSPVLNQVTSLDTVPGGVDYWNGSAWVPLVGATRELAYAQITVSKAVAQTSETSADLVVAAPAVSLDGATTVLIELFAPSIAPAAASGAGINMWLNQNGASIGRIGATQNNAAVLLAVPFYAARRMTPSAGSHTFAWAATQFGGNATIAAGPGGLGQYEPAYIRVTRA